MENEPCQIGGGWYDKIANKLTGSKLKDGEVHAPMFVNGKIKFGTYLGPGTKVVDNIRTGVKPISKVDKVALGHDIRYSLSTSPRDLYNADVRMLRKIKSIALKRQDNPWNIFIASTPIIAKMAGQKVGLVSKGAFGGDGDKVSPEDRQVLEKKLSEIKQLGYGVCGSRIL